MHPKVQKNTTNAFAPDAHAAGKGARRVQAGRIRAGIGDPAAALGVPACLAPADFRARPHDCRIGP